MSEDNEQQVLQDRAQIRSLKEEYRTIRGYYILAALFLLFGLPLLTFILPDSSLQEMASSSNTNVEKFIDTFGYVVLIGLAVLFAIASKHLGKINNKIETLHLKVSEKVLSFSNPEFEFNPENNDLNKLPEYERELEKLEAQDNRKKNVLFRASGCLNVVFGWGSLIVFLSCWGMLQSPSIGFGAILIFPILIISGIFAFIYVGSMIMRLRTRTPKNAESLDALKEKVAVLRGLQKNNASSTKALLQEAQISNADLSWSFDLQQNYKRNLLIATALVWAVLSYLIFGGAVWSFITRQSGFSSADFFSLLMLWFIYGRMKNYFNLAYQAEVKKKLFPNVCKALGLEYSMAPLFMPEQIEPHKIMPKHKFFYVDDAFRGEYKGRKIEFQEFISSRSSMKYISSDDKRNFIGRIKMSMIGPKAYLWKVKNNSANARGVMARIPLNQKMHFQTLALKKGYDAFRSDKGLKDIALLSPELEHRYKIISGDQIESRQIFDPAFMERFVLLADHLGGDQFAASFYDGDLIIIVLSNIDYFDVGDLSEPLSLECFEPLARHTKGYKEIIDLLDLMPGRGL